MYVNVLLNFRMSDTEEVEKVNSGFKSLKLRRKSIEIDVSELVRNKVLPTKSADLQRQEKYFNEFEKEIEANDQKSDDARKQIENYTQILSNMQAYLNNELTIDMDLHEHRELTAFMKTHVSV